MYILDGAMMNTKTNAHQHMQDEMGFPAYYGKNLDALYDCLTDLTGEIRLYHAAEMRRSLQGYAEKILRVFSDAQSDMLRIEIVD